MGKQVQTKAKKVHRMPVVKRALGNALKTMLKKKGGRKDIGPVADAPKSHDSIMKQVALKDRAGYPLKPTKGVNPAKWKTLEGKEIIVDFHRQPWLPDDWGQGVKATNPKKFKKTTGGGTYTVMVSPEGRVFYHRKDAEEYYGQAFSLELGFNGQVRTAKLNAKEAIQVARAQIKDMTNSKKDIQTDSDKSLFSILKSEEQKCIPPKSAFHFCIVSARRANKAEGLQDIFMVQSQFADAGVTPTWYVDAESLDDYKKLGLKAVVGGKLTPARNKALEDAERMGKICVQASDDISAWEYRHGKMATERTDDAMNKAHDAAKRYVLSPVAAAQFIAAKMRGSPDKPKLGGVYALGSCARTFSSEAFAGKNFVIGDFFVVDKGSKVRFDESLSLKEDYDFTCQHIHDHGSVMRCNRMTLKVKHYSNCGGACSTRDKKGLEEQRNIAILQKKWPRAIRDHTKRTNEVMLAWPADNDAKAERSPARRSAMKVIKTATKRSAMKAMQSSKPKGCLPKGVSLSSVLIKTSKVAKNPNINLRTRKVNGLRVEQAMAEVKWRSPGGVMKVYGISDVKYDLLCGYTKIRTQAK